MKAVIVECLVSQSYLIRMENYHWKYHTDQLKVIIIFISTSAAYNLNRAQGEPRLRYVDLTNYN